MTAHTPPTIPGLVYDAVDEHYYLDGCAGATFMLLPDTTYDAWRVTNLQVQRNMRRNGYGTEVLTALTDWADANRQRLTLFADPIGDGGPSTNRLLRWYRHHGFEHIKGKTRRLMLRTPPGSQRGTSP